MSKQIHQSSNKSTLEDVRNHYSEFLGLLAKRRDEILGFPLSSRWDLGRVGADPHSNLERSLKFLDSDYRCSEVEKGQQDKLLQIREAIDRMRDGVYGICKQCLRPIALADLRMQPEIVHCAVCLRSRPINCCLPKTPKHH